MRLVAFRIQNFRSIIDSGLCEISAENITALVGQNEAGKSSILEALVAFELSAIDPNDLRSDGSLPEIECEYCLTEQDVARWLESTSKALGVTFPASPTKDWRVGVKARWESPKIDDTEYSLSYKGIKDQLASHVAFLSELDPEIARLSAINVQDKPTIEAISIDAKLKAAARERAASRLETQLLATLFQLLPTFVLFNDDSSLLPSTIDIVDASLDKAAGAVGAENYFVVAGLDIAVLLSTPDRHRTTMLSKGSRATTTAFQQFWTQTVGMTKRVAIECDLKFYGAGAAEAKHGQPYLVFYIAEGDDKLYPSQRSKGVRWFVSFFLQLWAAARTSESVVFLLDEPGSNLHTKAQQDVLRVIEKSCIANQVIYSTHSPDLIRADKLGRVIAVQRDDTEDNASPTNLISAHKLSSASPDTMSAVYRSMGADFSRQNVIQRTDNVLLEELSALYYLRAFAFLFGSDRNINFLPATGVTNVPSIANMLTGWGIEFIVILDDDSRGREVARALQRDLFFGNEAVAIKRISRIRKCDGIEDIFSLADFAKVVLGSDEPIEGKCSAAAKNEAKGMLAYNFWTEVCAGNIQLADLSEETSLRASSLLKLIGTMLDDYPR